ncbi:hypothetical protein MPTA5024_28055 [Microbispora sp. ATCC PTA-5024]|nr:hypothetical protein MPTA5024_28055 [Microbispora sp. ATCC PTA-5024]
MEAEAGVASTAAVATAIPAIPAMLVARTVVFMISSFKEG